MAILTGGGVALSSSVAEAKPAAGAKKSTGKKTAKSTTAVKPKVVKVVALPRSRPAPPGSDNPQATEPQKTASVAAPAAPAVAAAVSVHLPRIRPDMSTITMVGYAGQAPFYGFRPNWTMKAALDALDMDNLGEARRLAEKVTDPNGRRLLEWLIARAPRSGLTPNEILAVLKSHEGWPEAERLRTIAEQSFHSIGPTPQEIVAFYKQNGEPTTIGGRLALAGALVETGQAEDGHNRIRELWREERLSSTQAALIQARFGSRITRDDNLYRFRRLVLQRRESDALAQAKLLGPGYDTLAKAVFGALDRKNPGKGPLKAVAKNFFQDPLYTFANARQLRRDGEPIAAARMLLNAPKDAAVLGDPDAWWDERQDLSRALLDRGVHDLAYRVAAEHSAESPQHRAEAEFHAGWYALRFLNSPAKAEPHFRKLLELATLPRTKARALYWLGRTYEAEKRTLSANAVYAEASQYGGNFYGQLAREKIGLRTTGVERVPQPTATDRVRFANREAVRAIRLLASSGHTDRAQPFFKHLAENVESPGEVTLTTALARRIGQPRAGMMAASTADQRGIPVASLSLPFMGVPTKIPLPEIVDRALVYAVARQESALNAEATSHVGARGLMQLMPETAKATARNIDMPFSLQRLNDPVYNATLGAQHLGDLLGSVRQSYILTFVAYNAGPGRARQWVQAYGDPRGGAVDAIDWIERIPFDETRNYVQKVMENLQVYRSRLGRPLSLSDDLQRGGPRG